MIIVVYLRCVKVTMLLELWKYAVEKANTKFIIHNTAMAFIYNKHTNKLMGISEMVHLRNMK